MHQTQSPLIDAYRRRTRESALLAERAAQLFPSGVTHDGRFLEPYPLYIDRAQGSRKWDVDGLDYVDYTGGHGALLLGHNHPEVVRAVQPQVARGSHYGACHELEIRWAEQVKKLMPACERIRFTSSGTEATHLALRLARAYTGKKKLLRFAGHFHGWHDHMAFGVSSHFDGTPTPGVLDDVARQVVLAPPGDVDATRAILEQDKDIAAAIIEPTGASWGQIPLAPSFLTALRELSAANGVLLIMDEVITGFRCAPGGAQGLYGITPDMTTLAKILAGGFPGGAVAGKKEIMSGLDFGASESAGREKIPHQGTFNANPISAAAGIATLKIVETTDACQRASDFAAELRQRIEKLLVDEQLPWIVHGTFSGFHLFTNPQGLSLTGQEISSGKVDYRLLKAPVRKSLAMKLRLGMIIHGVEIFSWLGGPTSCMHSHEDLERTLDALRGTIRMLRQENEL